MVQAVNGVGLVGLDDNFGAYHTVPAVGVAPQSITFATISDAKVTGPRLHHLADELVRPARRTRARRPVHRQPGHLAGDRAHHRAGTCSITASQAGNATVEPATSVTRTFTIAQAEPDDHVRDGARRQGARRRRLHGHGDGLDPGLPVTLSGSGACTVTGTTVHIVVDRHLLDHGQRRPATRPIARHSAVTVAIQVIWPFTGFSSPVDNLPTVNKANAGQAIPIKFSLGGDRGLAIFRSRLPEGRSPGRATRPPRPTTSRRTRPATAGSQYGGGQYTYVWKTDKSLAGKCVQFELGLMDGSTVPVANFKFK